MLLQQLSVPLRLLMGVGAACLLLLVSGCGNCYSGVAYTSIVLSVQDASTGADALAGAAVTVSGGGLPPKTQTFSANPQAPEDGARADGTVHFADPPGTYTVVVEKPGYERFSRTVKVEGDGLFCPAVDEPVRVRAKLTPLST